MADSAELANRFVYHPPKDDITVQCHEAIRKHCAQLAGLFDATLSDSREKSLAMTKLEEAMFWANAGIARNS